MGYLLKQFKILNIGVQDIHGPGFSCSGHQLANSNLAPGADRALVIVHWAGAFSPDFNENDFLLLRKTMHEEDLRSWLICKKTPFVHISHLCLGFDLFRIQVASLDTVRRTVDAIHAT